MKLQYADNAIRYRRSSADTLATLDRHGVAVAEVELVMIGTAGAADGPAPVEMDATSTLGTRFVMIDTVARFGHMLELYHPHPGLQASYVRIADMAGDFSQGVVLAR